MNRDEKKLKRGALILDGVDAGVIKEIDDLEEKVDANYDKLNTKITEALTIASETQKMEGAPGHTPVAGVDFPIPQPYAPKEEDLEKIAAMAAPLVKVEVPIVEKVIETIVREQPIVTEVVKEMKIENPVTAPEIVLKLESLKDENRLDISAIKGIETRELKLSDYLVERAIGIVDQRTSFLINKVSNLSDQVSRNSSGGLAIGASVSGGTSRDILYVDSNSKLAQSSDLTFIPSSLQLYVGTSTHIDASGDASFGTDNVRVSFGVASFPLSWALDLGHNTYLYDNGAADFAGGTATIDVNGNFASSSFVLRDNALLYGDATTGVITLTDSPGSGTSLLYDAATGNLKQTGGTNIVIGTVPSDISDSPFSGFMVGNDIGDTFNSFRFDGYADNFYMIARTSSGSIAPAGIVFRTAAGNPPTGADTEIDRLVIDGSGRVSVGTLTGISTSAWFHVNQTPTTTKAPFRINTGSLLTSAVAGSLEFASDRFYLTITTGTARKEIVLNDGTNLTSGRVPFCTTNGRLTDDADMTFATDTLTVTKIAATTFTGNVTIADTINFVLNTTTGTKIGTATNQKLGFFNKAPVVQPSAYTPTNVTTDRAYDANATTLDEVADVLGTLIADLQSLGLIG